MSTPITFVEGDLLVDISQAELDGIAKSIMDAGFPPITTTITEQRQKFYDYTRRFVVPDDRAKRLIRALVLYELYARLNPYSIPKFRADKQRQAVDELEEIRDGKFLDLQKADDPVGGPTATGATWGSEPKIGTNWMGRYTSSPQTA